MYYYLIIDREPFSITILYLAVEVPTSLSSWRSGVAFLDAGLANEWCVKVYPYPRKPVKYMPLHTVYIHIYIYIRIHPKSYWRNVQSQYYVRPLLASLPDDAGVELWKAWLWMTERCSKNRDYVHYICISIYSIIVIYVCIYIYIWNILKSCSWRLQWHLDGQRYCG